MFDNHQPSGCHPSSLRALVLGRAGMDLYPAPDGCKIHEATSFTSDLGGSAGNIAVAIAKAGATVGLISALSNDAVGAFVRQRLQQAGVDLSLVGSTHGNERTSLALAEVRSTDGEVVIYRNNPADLTVRCTEAIKLALTTSSHLVVTGTSLVNPDSCQQTLDIMTQANHSGCRVWLDLDYRAYNWPGVEITRTRYTKAAALAQVLIGNQEEFTLLNEDFTAQVEQCRHRAQIMVLKRGAKGACLFTPSTQLTTGIYQLPTLKSYGSGDAFLGNLLVHYIDSHDWMEALDAGSAAAALVISQRGCASVMPTPEQLQSLRQKQTMFPPAHWS